MRCAQIFPVASHAVDDDRNVASCVEGCHRPQQDPEHLVLYKVVTGRYCRVEAFRDKRGEVVAGVRGVHRLGETTRGFFWEVGAKHLHCRLGAIAERGVLREGTDGESEFGVCTFSTRKPRISKPSNVGGSLVMVKSRFSQ